MADVGGGLDHPSTCPGHQGGDRLHRDDRSGVVLIARGRRALRAIDAADDRRQREGDHHREEADRVGPGLEPLEAQCRHPRGGPEGSPRIDGGMVAGGDHPGCRAEEMDATGTRSGEGGSGQV